MAPQTLFDSKLKQKAKSMDGPKDKPNHQTRNNLNGKIALTKTSKQKFGQISGEFSLSRGRVMDELQTGFG